jgi:site-specific DNA recombinase
VSGKWSAGAVQKILKNRSYEGTYRFGESCSGKFYFFTKDGPVERKVDSRTFNNEEDVFVIEDVFPALVSKADFKAAQVKLRKNQANTGPKRQNYLLSGILKCGHFGKSMIGSHPRQANRYFCGLYSQCGVSACGGHSIREDQLVAYLTRLMQQLVDINEEELKRRIDKKLTDRNGKQPARAKRLQEKLDKIDANIKKAVGRLAICSDGIVGLMSEQIAKMRSQRKDVAAELRSAEPVSACTVVSSDDVIKRMRILQSDLIQPIPLE